MRRAMRYIGLLARLAAGGLFVYAGWMKARDPGAFYQDIDSYLLLPRVAAVAWAHWLPYLEIACGAALALGRPSRGALAILVALMLLFVSVNLSAHLRGLDFSCGCFGPSEEPPGLAYLLARDAGILALLALGALGRGRPRRVNGAGS